MGFGLLFIGYALAFAFSISSTSIGSAGITLSAVPYFFSDVLGGLIMTYALAKLSAYNKKFRYALIIALVFSLLSAFSAVNRFFLHLSDPWLLKFTESFLAASIIVFHAALFIGIISIAKEVRLPKIVFKSRRNLIIMILYFTLYTLSLLSHDFVESTYPNASRYLYLFLTLFQYVWLFMNLLLIGSCLKWIGEEGEDSVDPAPGRLKRIYSMWSEKEDKIFTPKEKRSEKDKKNKK